MGRGRGLFRERPDGGRGFAGGRISSGPARTGIIVWRPCRRDSPRCGGDHKPNNSTTRDNWRYPSRKPQPPLPPLLEAVEFQGCISDRVGYKSNQLSD